ncbi:hypothetical protein ACIBH1_32990 [Nonomuraea sp. NPDC050663]|uniref:hypothetical protein n=1 Tax=Nonomuraea sp. NPDC050663 TaxID=3364370 RepID=UPI00378F55C4
MLKKEGWPREGWREPALTFLRGRIARALAAALIGALVGLIAYRITQAGGAWVFLVTGALAGVASVLAVQLYGRAATLTEVKITVPQFSELTFAVNDESRKVAWGLFVETVTRVSTQRLDEDEGLLREAMNSLYSLFAITREALKAARPSPKVPGSQTVEYFAIMMLNQQLRPFLSVWHPQLRDFERDHPDLPESAWEHNAECRAELTRVQEGIRRYAEGFARLAGVAEPEKLIA